MPNPNKPKNASRLGFCKVCTGNEAKYKCPACNLPYCSIKCFKQHKEEKPCSGSSVAKSADLQRKDETTTTEKKDLLNVSDSSTLTNPLSDSSTKGLDSAPLVEANPLFDQVLQDAQLSSLLQDKSLQFHLKNIFSLMSDPAHSGESTSEGRRAVALRKLTELRMGGLESNEIVEMFCSRVSELLKQKEDEA